MTVNTQELRELAEKATPGPWTWKQVGTYSTPGVALFWPDSSKGGVHYRRLDANGGMTEADADLITNAVRALPALLAENDALRAELQAHRSFLSALKAELGLVLTDDDTELSPGALRTLLWADREMTNALALPPAPPQGDGA